MLSPQDWHLRFQQQARWTASVRRFLFDEMKLGQAQRALEAGCGTGVIAAQIQAAGAARMYGIDLKREFLALARNEFPALELAQADALRLPYPDGAFDFTFCHYFLLWVADRQQALREMRRVTRPGGAVLALAEPDYGGRIDFPNELREIGRLQGAALRRQGADPEIGRSLAGLLLAAGLSNVRSGVLGGQWGGPQSEDDLHAEWQMLSADLKDLTDESSLAAYRQQDAAAWRTGERILFIPTFYAWGTV